MDKIVTKTGMMHKHCLSCNECKTNLDVSSFHNGFDGEVYCKHDYAVKFGHKQKSQYKGWNDVKAIMGEVGDKSACPRCTGMVSVLKFFYSGRPLKFDEISEFYLKLDSAIKKGEYFVILLLPFQNI